MGRSRSGSPARTSRRTRPACRTRPAADGRRVSLVDFNRSGAPLMEIVTEPDIRTAEQARRYAEELQLLLRAIGASDADMERGQMRVEANVSLRSARHRGVRDARRDQEHELVPVRRAGDRRRRSSARRPRSTPASRSSRRRAAGTTRGRTTYRMRIKESSDDYRYFPEPDLPPLHLDAAWLDAIRARHAGAAGGAAGSLRHVAGPVAYDAELIVADQRRDRAVRGALAGARARPAKESRTG